MKTKILVGILLIATVFIAGCTGNKISTSRSGEALTISLSELSSKAKFYTLNDDGIAIRYFAVLGSDGKPRTGFDACDVCYRSQKGYRQEENYMICNNCGNKYQINGLGTKNTKGGGCWPGYLPSNVESGSLLIKNSDIIRESWRFK